MTNQKLHSRDAYGEPLCGAHKAAPVAEKGDTVTCAKCKSILDNVRRRTPERAAR